MSVESPPFLPAWLHFAPGRRSGFPPPFKQSVVAETLPAVHPRRQTEPALHSARKPQNCNVGPDNSSCMKYNIVEQSACFRFPSQCLLVSWAASFYWQTSLNSQVHHCIIIKKRPETVKFCPKLLRFLPELSVYVLY